MKLTLASTLCALVGSAIGSASAQESIQSLTFQSLHQYQHYGFFFVMVHDDSIGPLYVPNAPAPPGMESMCESGDPTALVEAFTDVPGVRDVRTVPGALFAQGWENEDLSPLAAAGATFGVGSVTVPVDIPSGCRVTVMMMIANSNDGCVILNGENMVLEQTVNMIEIDAGTEQNTESCENIFGCLGLPATPTGPLCPCGARGNEVDPGNGEGFMSAHIGVGKRNNRVMIESDWRHTMVQVTAHATPPISSLTFESLHPYHHYGFFFVMVHDDSVDPLYVPDAPAPPGMESMCESGDPTALVAALTGVPGVRDVRTVPGALFAQGWENEDLSPLAAAGATFGVGSVTVPVDIPSGFRVTVMMMIANSNDGCVILNGENMVPEQTLSMIEIDAGTEQNTESCDNIFGCLGLPATPTGPLCPCGARGNDVDPGNGEGFMSAHPGILGRNDGILIDSDWRQSMVRVTANL